MDPSPAQQAAARARLTGLIALAVVLAVWIVFQLASRAGVRGALGPADLLALRYIVAGGCTLPWFCRRGFAGLGPWRVSGSSRRRSYPCDCS